MNCQRLPQSKQNASSREPGKIWEGRQSGHCVWAESGVKDEEEKKELFFSPLTGEHLMAE